MDQTIDGHTRWSLDERVTCHSKWSRSEKWCYLQSITRISSGLLYFYLHVVIVTMKGSPIVSITALPYSRMVYRRPWDGHVSMHQIKPIKAKNRVRINTWCSSSFPTKHCTPSCVESMETLRYCQDWKEVSTQDHSLMKLIALDDDPISYWRQWNYSFQLVVCETQSPGLSDLLSMMNYNLAKNFDFPDDAAWLAPM
jgi:hypothetical protein